jgi:hypothetical protein
MSAKKLQKRLKPSSRQINKTVYLSGQMRRKLSVQIMDERGGQCTRDVELPTGCVGVIFAFGSKFRAQCYGPKYEIIELRTVQEQ